MPSAKWVVTKPMKQSIESTYKSSDTEEWLDRVFTRPVGFLWARFFERLGIHPNTVTILSIIIGVSSAFFLVHGSYRTEGTRGLLLNITGVALMMWANFYDSADGQLARMTNQKTQLGRILDGAASMIIFFPVYLALIWRFHEYHAMEFRWLGIDDTPRNTLWATLVVFAVAAVSALVCHAGQCRLSDYYRQVHLFFVQGKAGSELDTSAHQQQLYDATPWKGHLLYKLFLLNYVGYTRMQERQTPWFQQLMQLIRTRYGAAEHIPQTLRDEFRLHSLPLMPLTNILTYNTRAIALYVSCLVDLPWLYFVFEIVVLSVLWAYMHARHEAFCRKLCRQ